MKNFLHKKSLPYITMASLFVGMGLIGWLGIVPFQRFIVEKADEIQKFHTSRENRERQLKKLPDLQAQFEAIGKDEGNLDILLSEDRIVDFVKTLEEKAQETNVEIVIQSKDKGAVEEKKPPKATSKKSGGATEEKEDAKSKIELTLLDLIPYDRYLRISVGVKGEYGNIVNFLNKMETLPYGLDVIGVTMKIVPEDEEGTPATGKSNPFALDSGDVLSSTVKEEVVPGRIEATFDTIVYIRKAQ